ncbi:PBSX family phage portal protein [Croceifilum oryzae]|uniref:PBSX family phage portal protein n=1 Tax=Croceifilum oryzae TaxID=1553429 RepID=A0AAJ1WTX7_9BACL|nr:phage portal protein [Croceifilum oryzae]MDQ0418468.1 PBSX family phage portal protein [Croceifilum oryzae]
MDKSQVKAYVLKDGEVITNDYLQRYSVKSMSKQIPSDVFINEYGERGVVEPLYNVEALAKLMEMNTYHYRAVKVKARDTVGLGWKLKPMEGIENPNESQKESVLPFLNSLHPEKTLGEVLSQWMEDFEATGNGYLELIRDESQQLIGIEHIPSHTMRRHVDDSLFLQIRGTKKRWFKRAGAPWDVHDETGEKFALGGLSYDERATEIIHILNYSPRSDYYGVPDVLPALGAILGDKEREEFNISFFENHAIPAYAVTVSGADLDKDTEDMIKRFFQKDLKENRHATLVLTASGGEEKVEFNFQALAVDVQEASFRLYRKDNRDEVLSSHGVPSYRIGISEDGSLGGSTAEESTEIYKQSIINPRQEMVEARLNKHILNAFGVSDWIFKFNEIDNRDEVRQTEVFSRQFNMGAITPNKVRELIGEVRMDHPLMDSPYINGVPIDQLKSWKPPIHSPDELLKSIKSLHERLLEVVTK